MTFKHVLWDAGDRSSKTKQKKPKKKQSHQTPKPQKTKRTIGKVTKFCLTLKKHLHSVQTKCSNIWFCKALSRKG